MYLVHRSSYPDTPGGKPMGPEPGPSGTKIGKACEPCRRRKVRCNGEEPCQHCKRSSGATCVYRLKARTRKSRAQIAARQAGPPLRPSNEQKQVAVPAETDSSPEADQSTIVAEAPTPSQHEQEAHSQVHQSVAAREKHSATRESPQLFYGASSNFAFLQQVHRGIISCSRPGQLSAYEVQEGGPGLDMFMMRAIFFGPPMSKEALNIRGDMLPISVEQAEAFLGHFKESWHTIHHMFTISELDGLVASLFNERVPSHGVRPPHHALALAILASGALLTDQTGIADSLFMMSKNIGSSHDDVVNITMIQHAMVLGDYQLNLGRPNSSYLFLGIACRKAYAIGLFKRCNPHLGEEDLRRRRETMWCLYFHENWHALTMGRKSAVRLNDIACPLPNDSSWASGMYRIANIAEEGAELIYDQRHSSLRKLYSAAEKVHRRLQQFAQEFGIGAADLAEGKTVSERVGQHQMHKAYYHTVLLTFRPFLIAQSALQRNGTSQKNDEMWLRQATRHATEAAQDSIVWCAHQVRSLPAVRNIRYNAFFLESSCAVLLHDILWHPSKYAYHIEYVQMAVDAMGVMVHDEPVRTARNSMQQILKIVEQCVLQGKNGNGPSNGEEYPLSSPTTVAATETARPPKMGGETTTTTMLDGLHEATYPPSSGGISFPSLGHAGSVPAYQMDPHAEDLIYFSNHGATMDQQALMMATGQESLDHSLGAAAAGSALLSGGGGDGANIDFLHNFNYDVLTTDLFNMFPMHITTPEDAVADPGSVGGGIGRSTSMG